MSDREDSDNEGDDDQGGEEAEETDQESESENEVDDNMTANESTASLSGFPATPNLRKTGEETEKIIKTHAREKGFSFR